MSTKPQAMSEYADDFLGGTADRSRALAGMGRQSPKQRLAEREERMNKPSECPSCGSTWFREETFNQYRAETYSARAGGDLEVISEMPQTLRVCLCGRPLSPNIGGALHGGATPSENMTSFRQSLKSALDYLNGLGADPVPVVRKMLATAMTQGCFAEELEKIGARVGELAGVLESLTQPAPAAGKQG